MIVIMQLFIFNDFKFIKIYLILW